MNDHGNRRILAEGIEISNDTRLTHLNNNDLIIGPTGAGKTTGYVIPNLLRRCESMVVTDTKGNLARRFGPELRRHGFEVKVLDFVNQSASCGYNPLQYVRPAGAGYCEQDILTLADTIQGTVRSNDDMFWSETSKTVLASLIAFALEALPEDEQHLGSVVQLLEALGTPQGKRAFQRLASVRGDCFAVRQYRLYKNLMMVERTWGCVYQYASTALQPFSSREAQAIFTHQSPLRIEELGRRPMVLFINVSDTDRTFDRVVNIFYTQALQALCAEADRQPDSRLRQPVRLILDDFAAGTKIPHFDNLISVIRSRGISVTPVLQSLSQLKSMYGEHDTATILNNCDHILYLGGSDLDTVSYIASRVRTNPEKVMEMQVDKAWVLERGSRARLVDRTDPFRGEREAEITALHGPRADGLSLH